MPALQALPIHHGGFNKAFLDHPPAAAFMILLLRAKPVLTANSCMLRMSDALSYNCTAAVPVQLQKVDTGESGEEMLPDSDDISKLKAAKKKAPRTHALTKIMKNYRRR